MNKKVKISFKSILNFLLLLILFEPNIFVKYTFLNSIFIVGAAISFFVALLKILKIRKISKFTAILILYRAVLILMTTIFSGDLLKVGYNSIVLISLFLFAEIYASEDKFHVFVIYIYRIMLVYLLLNIFLYILYPNGLYDLQNGINFLGIRTRFTEYCMALFSFSLANYFFIKHNKLSLLCSIIIIYFNIFLPHIATAIVGAGTIVITYTLISLLMRLKKFSLSFNSFFGIGLGVTVSVVFLRIQKYFSFIIEKLLNKSMDLTGRINIWDDSYRFIFDKYIFLGHGMPREGNFILWHSQLWQAHNQMLQTLYESGLVGTILFYYLIYISFNQLKFMNNKKYSLILCAVLFSMLIMMITEIYGYYIPTYTLFILSYYSPKLNLNNVRDI